MREDVRLKLDELVTEWEKLAAFYSDEPAVASVYRVNAKALRAALSTQGQGVGHRRAWMDGYIEAGKGYD